MPFDLKEKHYRDLYRKHIFRLIFTYLMPLILIVIFFEIQYNRLLSETRNLHMLSIAESKASLLDLFLRERIANLINLIDDPNLEVPPSPGTMSDYLEKLERDSEAFIDIGFFDSSGVQVGYAGPLPLLKEKDYSREQWYLNLLKSPQRFHISDIYLGFRKEPHFTIAVRKILNDQIVVMRATLDPKKIYDYMTASEGVRDVQVSMVDTNGLYQLVPSDIGNVLDSSMIQPEKGQNSGMGMYEPNGDDIHYAYSWLDAVNWAVIVQSRSEARVVSFWDFQFYVILISFSIISVMLYIIFTRAKKFVEMEKEKDIARSQLAQAAKLASVGELASGIAHEINNPLAIIGSEAGLMRDLIGPEFREETKFDDLLPMIQNIEDATYRCRDITRKLLSFVRDQEIKLKEHDLNELMDDLIEGFFEKEFEVSNIDIDMKLEQGLPRIYTDSNQLRQVLVNIIKNAMDAIQGPGEITIETFRKNGRVAVAITDSGIGIEEENIEKIFMPFYTTKDVGKGTGLGLSVSYGIIQNLGGDIEVESILGKGTTFTVYLPINEKDILKNPENKTNGGN